ncbi:MAG: hypothetical protein EHM34_00075 [Nitrosopumilales archaeon]|nr:MAG: hypothetical protein EHM34_00075 [Nitrosopumilales archaeon]
MKHYIVTQPKEFGTYLRGDTVDIYINIKDTLTNQLSDPSSVNITIRSPSNVVVDGPTPMINLSTGIYEHEYSIPTSTTIYPFGIYEAHISTVTDSSLTVFNFVVFPWDVVSRIRSLSGISQQADISDYHLATLAWLAYEETLETIYEMHEKEKPLCDPVTGDYIDGVNTTFQLTNYPLADHNGDEQITGSGQIAYGWDVEGYYIDSTGAKQTCIITVSDSSYGMVTITTGGATPIPADACGIYVKYYTESPTYNKQLMQEAVACLSAYKAAIAFQSLNKATLADLQTNRDMLYNRFLIRYDQIIEEIGFPNIGAGK